MLLLLASLSSCIIDDVEKSEDFIYPIKTGNTWTYERTSYIEDSLYLTDTIDMVVGQRVTVDGLSGYSFDNKEMFDGYSFDNMEIFDGVLFLVDNDTYGNFITYGCYKDSFSRVDRSIRFKLKATKNGSWYYHGFSWGWYTGTIITSNLMECLSTDTLISTPKADFHCMAFRESYPLGERYSYLSTNVGLVKQETLFDNGNKLVERLIEYKLY
jgi:hypothetical protein